MAIVLLYEVLILAVLLIGGIFFLFWRFYFLRNPDRAIPEGSNVVSPCDGKVMDVFMYNLKKDLVPFVVKKGKKGCIKTMLEDVASEGYIISIFMSPLDVHYNRAPIAGKVVYQQHVPGRFNHAGSDSALIENEKNEIIIEGKIRVKAIQIAGALARRIESFVKVGDHVEKGEVYGLINLGSQVTLVLPKRVSPIIQKGAKVKAGETIIGMV